MQLLELELLALAEQAHAQVEQVLANVVAVGAHGRAEAGVLVDVESVEVEQERVALAALVREHARIVLLVVAGGDAGGDARVAVLDEQLEDVQVALRAGRVEGQELLDGRDLNQVRKVLFATPHTHTHTHTEKCKPKRLRKRSRLFVVFLLVVVVCVALCTLRMSLAMGKLPRWQAM